VQVDEKWSFVYKKEKHRDEHDERDLPRGDNWDFVALDPDSRLVLAVVVGKRLLDHAVELLHEVKRRLAGQAPQLLTSDELSAYETAIVAVFGEKVPSPRTGRPGRPAGPVTRLPQQLAHAVVHKRRERGRVVEVTTRVALGQAEAVSAALGGRAVSTSYLERQHGTDRHRNARKARKTYRFSKDFAMHEALTWFSLYSYNFCWPVRTLRIKRADGGHDARTPAMVAELTDHVWSLKEWLAFPSCQRS
jgi:IS1 family transposase